MTPRKPPVRHEVKIFCRNMGRASKAVKDGTSTSFYCWACGRILGKKEVEDDSHRREVA